MILRSKEESKFMWRELKEAADGGWSEINDGVLDKEELTSGELKRKQDGSQASSKDRGGSCLLQM